MGFFLNAGVLVSCAPIGTRGGYRPDAHHYMPTIIDHRHRDAAVEDGTVTFWSSISF